MTRPRTLRYLALTGAFSRWQTVTLLLLIVFALVEFAVAGRSEAAVPMSLVLFPVFMGTGLLHAARQGRLDLLLGAGEPRIRIYWKAAARAFALPLLIAAVLIPFFFENWSAAESANRLVRGLSIVSLTGGMCFAAGLVQPAYLAGAAWIFFRIAALMSPWGARFMAELSVWSAGGPRPAAWKTGVATLVFPEIVLAEKIPLLFVLPMAVLGVAALLLGASRFRVAEFAGKRRE